MGLFDRRKSYKMADNTTAEDAMEKRKRRAFRKYTYRGVDLDQLLDMSPEQLMELFCCRSRRRYSRGLTRKPMTLVKRLRKAKKEAPPMEKPEVVKTHLRNMVIIPEMIGHYLGEFSITYKPVKHGRPGIGATHSSRFIPHQVEDLRLPDEEAN